MKQYQILGHHPHNFQVHVITVPYKTYPGLWKTWRMRLCCLRFFLWRLRSQRSWKAESMTSQRKQRNRRWKNQMRRASRLRCRNRRRKWSRFKHWCLMMVEASITFLWTSGGTSKGFDLSRDCMRMGGACLRDLAAFLSEVLQPLARLRVRTGASRMAQPCAACSTMFRQNIKVELVEIQDEGANMLNSPAGE